MDYPNIYSMCSNCFDQTDDDIRQIVVAYHACDITGAWRMVVDYLPKAESFDQRMVSGLLLGICALHKGDIAVWKQSENLFAEMTCVGEEQMSLYQTLYAILRLSIYDAESVPRWLQIGQLGSLPPTLFALGSYAYLKYLCVTNQEKLLMAAVEPLVEYARRDGMQVMELCMRMIAAIGYRFQDREKACYQLENALRLANQTNDLVAVAEYRPSLDTFFNDHCQILGTERLRTVQCASNQLFMGYAKLRNTILGRSVTTRLSPRELEAARYACRGLSNTQIAQHMGLRRGSVGAVLHNVYIKLDVKGREELIKFLL